MYYNIAKSYTIPLKSQIMKYNINKEVFMRKHKNLVLAEFKKLIKWKYNNF